MTGDDREGAGPKWASKRGWLTEQILARFIRQWRDPATTAVEKGLIVNALRANTLSYSECAEKLGTTEDEIRRTHEAWRRDVEESIERARSRPATEFHAGPRAIVRAGASVAAGTIWILDGDSEELADALKVVAFEDQRFADGQVVVAIVAENAHREVTRFLLDYGALVDLVELVLDLERLPSSGHDSPAGAT